MSSFFPASLHYYRAVVKEEVGEEGLSSFFPASYITIEE